MGGDDLRGFVPVACVACIAVLVVPFCSWLLRCASLGCVLVVALLIVVRVWCCCSGWLWETWHGMHVSRCSQLVVTRATAAVPYLVVAWCFPGLPRSSAEYPCVCVLILCVSRSAIWLPIQTCPAC